MQKIILVLTIMLISFGGCNYNDDSNNAEVTPSKNIENPTESEINKSKIIEVSAGGYFTVALKDDGTVIAWGKNNYGQCNVPSDLRNVKQISAGYEHAVALREDGTALVWGRYSLEQNQFISKFQNIKDISANYSYTAFVCETGKLYSCGNSEDVDFGAEGLVFKDVVEKVDTAEQHLLALDRNGNLIITGRARSELVNIPDNIGSVADFSACSSFCVALNTNGEIFAWGFNSAGELDVPDGLSDVVDIETGWFTGVALRENGTLVSWGAADNKALNESGEIKEIIDVSVSRSHIAALKSDGTVFIWGDWKDEYEVPPPSDVVVKNGYK